MNDNKEYQTYLKNCKCERDGILIYEGSPCCRWCSTSYAKGGTMLYNNPAVRFTDDQIHEIKLIVRKILNEINPTFK